MLMRNFKIHNLQSEGYCPKRGTCWPPATYMWSNTVYPMLTSMFKEFIQKYKSPGYCEKYFLNK